MLGFAGNIVFFRVHGGSVAEKSWFARATVSGVVALPWNLARTARAVELMVPGDFFSALMMLCYCVLMCFACVEMLCALELHPSDVFYSSALQFYCA